MRYKFFNNVIHQGLRGWGKGGEETWGEGGAQKCVSPMLVYLEGQCGHLRHCNPEQKVLTNYKKIFASIQLAKVEMLALLHTRSLPKDSSQSATLAELTIRKASRVFWDGDHDVCEAGCLIPPWGVKSGVNAAPLQHHMLSANSEKNPDY